MRLQFPLFFFDYFKYVERILSIPISLGDFDFVYCFYSKIKENLDKVVFKVDVNFIVNGENYKGEINREEYFNDLVLTIKNVFFDSLIKNFNSEHLNKKIYNFYKLIFDVELDASFFNKLVNSVILSDLAYSPLKNYMRKISSLEVSESILKGFSKEFDISLLENIAKLSLSKNLSYARRDLTVISDKISLNSFLFPTRPYNSLDISDLLSEELYHGSLSNLERFELWRNTINAVNGELYITENEAMKISDNFDENYFSSIDKTEKEISQKIIAIGNERKDYVRIAITNFLTTEEEWSYTADNKSKLTFERYQRFKRIIDQILTLEDKPDYVIFPELSIPFQWLSTLINRMAKSKISFIAGTEYEHHGVEIYSSAFMVLHDTSLGCSTWQLIKQPKLLPAVGEDESLQLKYGKVWKKFHELKKPVYIHNGFCFGVMICSELQNSKDRVSFQGNIDGLFILSWNRDIETFGDLIKSAALDVHSFIILVNNRKYGDSRVRIPSKSSWMRDLARIRGGDNDYVVSVTLNYNELRDFQSRAKRWASDSDKFKPTPEGFTILPLRRITPIK